MEKEELGRSYKCGLGQCWLKSMQRCATMPVFGGLLFAFVIVYGIQNVYLFAVITNIEKTFGYTSKETGSMVTCLEIGYFFTIILGHFGHRINRPMVIGMGGVLIGIAGFIMTLPHFLFYNGINYENNFTVQNSDNLLCTKNNSVCNTQIHTNSDAQNAKILFIIAMILTGFGSIPIWTVGMAFLDDNTAPGRTSVYVGVLFSAQTVAPVFGLLVGSATLSFHIDLKDSSETGLEAADNNFIGAWWLGYLFTAPLVILISIPLIIFPKRLRKYDEEGETADTIQPQETDNGHQENTEKLSTPINEIKDLIQCLYRVFKNVPFMFYVISVGFQLGPIHGYFIFLPKYLEQQFNITSTTANILIAFVFALSPAVSFALSGIITSTIIRKYKMKIWRLCLYSTYVAIALCLVFALFFLFGCETGSTVGVNLQSNRLHLDNKCNMGCNCSSSEFEPLCGEDGNTYFSACYAGCSSKLERTYSNCSCLEDGFLDAVLGTCSSTCSMIIIFSVFTFILGFIESLIALPWTLFSFRILEPRDKSMGMAVIALGITIVLLFIPPIYGSVIDESCAIERQGESCGADKSTCLIYDQYKFRINLHALTFGLRLGYPLCLVISLWTSRNKVLHGDEDEEKESKSINPRNAAEAKNKTTYVENGDNQKENCDNNPKAKADLHIIEEYDDPENTGLGEDEEEIAV